MKQWNIFFGVLVLLGVGLMFVLLRHKPEPLTYQGKSIEQWFAQLPVAVIPPPGNQFGNARAVIKSYGQEYGNTNSSDGRTVAALEAFGTNALPFLLAKLEGRDSTGEQLAFKAARETGVREVPFRDAGLERLQAVTGLIQIKTLTPEARQSITVLSTNMDTHIASAAAHILKRRAEQGDGK